VVAIAVVAAVVAALLMFAVWQCSTRLPRHRVVVSGLSPADLASSAAPNRFGSVGFHSMRLPNAEDALALAPDRSGLWTNLVTFAPGESVTLALAAANGGPLRSVLAIQPPSADGAGQPIQIPLPETGPDAPLLPTAIDLTPFLSPTDHYFYLTIAAEYTAPPDAPTLPVAAGLELRFTAPPPPPPRRSAAAFFLLVGAAGWWAILGWMLPRAAHRLRRLWTAARSIPARTAGAAILLTAAGWLALHPVWRDAKQYDDRWALANSRLLAQQRFNTDRVFFRSRIRPGFPALALPLTTCLPHTLIHTTYNPADEKQRLFYIFDRQGALWATTVYPEAAAWGLTMALLGALLVGACVARLPCRLPCRLQSRRATVLLAILFALWFLHRTLSGPLLSPITLSVGWTFQAAAFLAFLELLRRPTLARLAPAAGLTALAILIKEDALALILAVALCQLDHLLRAPRRRARLLPLFALYWLLAALPALVYFGAVIDGGFGEIAANFRQHLDAQQGLDGFETRSPAGLARALWSVFGLGLVPVALGLALAIRSRRQTSKNTPNTALYWAVGGLTPLLLPYFYPRFFVYLIGPAAWLAAVGTAACLRRLGPQPRPDPAPPAPSRVHP
jgi:hypothetical protein